MTLSYGPHYSAWKPASGAGGKRTWFLYRYAPAIPDRYHYGQNGLIRYGSYKAALKAAEKFNASA